MRSLHSNIANMNATDSNSKLVAKIKDSSLYQSYEKAFQAVSGLPLLLVPAHSSGEYAAEEGSPTSRFCQLLNKSAPCRECSHSHVGLIRESKGKAHTCTCFAGLQETAVPVRLGEETVAYLRTGQVLPNAPKPGDFKEIGKTLSGEGYTDDEIRALRTAYFETQVVPEDRLNQVVTLLAIFSLQLSNLVNQLVLAKNEDEPPVITKAKQFIRGRLQDRLSLDDVANAVGISSFYFCKLFKQTTSMTFTEYVNRKRVECAKRALLKPHARITEVAFEIGYQSLSQFNRSFLKYVGESPTQYRKRMQRSSKQGADILAC
jgi:AraC-like DNA-binding protein/ligand-binding sensor protein